MGPVETEIKLRMASPEGARAALLAIGATLVRARHLEDNFLFDDAAGSLRGVRKILRLRRTAEGAVLTFKGPREVVDGVKSREEVETGLTEGDAALRILEGVGFRPVFRYQKYREVYRWRSVEIVVDETPIGTFLEIEGDVATIHAAAAALGFTPADYVAESYGGLFAAGGGTGDMVFS